MLNNQFTKPACGGAADFASTPPILKFKIPLNESAIIACGNSFKVLFKIILPFIGNWEAESLRSCVYRCVSDLQEGHKIFLFTKIYVSFF